MKIGGKMYLAEQSRLYRSRGYRQQLNRQAAQANLANMQTLGQSIFSTNVSAGQEAASLTMQIATDRITASLRAVYENALSSLSTAETIAGPDSDSATTSSAVDVLA